MAKIKAKVIGYDVPERGPMLKLQIKEPLKGQKFVVDAKGQPAKVDVWNEAAMDYFFEHTQFSDLIAQDGVTAAPSYDAEQFGSLLVTHVDYIEFHAERKTVEKDNQVYHNYAVMKVDAIVLKQAPSQEKVVSISEDKDTARQIIICKGQAINLAFEHAMEEKRKGRIKPTEGLTFQVLLDKAYDELMPWILEKQGLELPKSEEEPKEEVKEEVKEEKTEPMPWDETDDNKSSDVATQDDLW